jgi:hypothetical protein
MIGQCLQFCQQADVHLEVFIIGNPMHPAKEKEQDGLPNLWFSGETVEAR